MTRPVPVVTTPSSFEEHPREFLASLHQQHGDIVAVDLDGVPTVFCGGVEGTALFAAAERGQLSVVNSDLVHELFGPAIFNLQGGEHAAARGLLRSGLGGPQVRAYAPLALEVAVSEAAKWADADVDVYPAARALTMAACAQLVLGIPDSDPELATLTSLFDDFVAGTLLPSARRRERPEYGPAVAAGHELRRRFGLLIRAAADRNDRVGGSEHDTSAGTNLVSSCVRHSARTGSELDRLPHHLLAVLVAMRETTASLITWMLMELARDPNVADLVFEDACAFADEPLAMTDRAAGAALRAVLLEIERLHSPNVIGLRRADVALRLGGYEVPAGWQVAYSPSAVHLTEEFCPHAHRFDPSRFSLNHAEPTASGTSAEDASATAGRLLTFGFGLHACPGKGLAELLALATAAAVLPAFRLSLASPETIDIRELPVKAPRSPMIITFDRRREVHP